MSVTVPTRTHRLAPSEVAGAIGVAGFGVALALSPAHIDDGPILCPFRLATGLPCPGCGLTRSWVYGAHGDWAQSFAAHPFGLPLLMGLLLLAAAAIAQRVRHREPPRLDRLIWNPVAKFVLAGWVIFGVVRLVLAI
ncbi:DUF2752 domain-containing protein [Gordonia sp. NPDC003950]